MADYLGIDIGGTKCAVVLGASSDAGDMHIADKISFLTSEEGFRVNLKRVLHSTEQLLLRNPLKGNKIKAAGISCGGPLDSRRGLILSPPNLPGWDLVPIVEEIEKRLQVPAALQNDANACALAEWRFGAAKGCDNAVFLTFGTGLGAGLILNGRLYSGANDMAGEIGHVRMETHGPVGYGKAGSLEGFCSGGGIAQLARSVAMERLQQGKGAEFCPSYDCLKALTAKQVAEAAFAGDPSAREGFEISGRYLGSGLSLLIDLLNPEVIVIGSIFARCRDLLWPAAQAMLERESLPLSRGVCRVVPSALGEAIGDYGSLAVAAECAKER